MAKKEMSTPQFSEADFLVKVKECGNSMARGDFFKNKSSSVVDEPSEKEKSIPPKQRTRNKGDYKSIFLIAKPNKKKPMRVSISGEYYVAMTRLLGEMGDEKISINNYLNNIIECHFDQNSNEINELFQKKQSSKLL